jgi:hypothetical protein
VPEKNFGYPEKTERHERLVCRQHLPRGLSNPFPDNQALDLGHHRRRLWVPLNVFYKKSRKEKWGFCKKNHSNGTKKESMHVPSRTRTRKNVLFE